MSTIKSFDNALDFYPADERHFSLARVGRAVRLYWQGLHEGLDAAATYKDLTSRGVSHDEAVSRVFSKHFTR